MKLLLGPICHFSPCCLVLRSIKIMKAGTILSKSCRRQRKSIYQFNWKMKCKVCVKKFNSQFWLQRHLRIHAQEKDTSKRYVCTNCHKGFKEIANFLRHCSFHAEKTKKGNKEVSHRGNSANPTQHSYDVMNSIKDAKEGNMKFGRATKEKIIENDIPHQMSFTPKNDPVQENKFTCHLCGKEYALRFYFELHIKHHKGTQMFYCDMCPKSYREKARLHSHKRVSHGQGFCCLQCGDRFSTKEQFDRHRLEEIALRTTCKFCDKVFATAKTLKTHERIHTGEKPFKCDKCAASFTQQTHLIDHERTHDGLTPFSCSYCGQAFTTQSSRRRHEKNMHGVGLTKHCHLCEICNASYSRKDGLIRHMKQHGKTGSELADQKQVITDSQHENMANNNDSQMMDENINRKNFDRRRKKSGLAFEKLMDAETKTISNDSNEPIAINVEQDEAACEEETRNDCKSKLRCNVCDKFYSSTQTLKRHLKSVHKKAWDGRDSLVCEVCNVMYINTKTLRRHLLKVHEITTVRESFTALKCDVCGAFVPTKNGLQLHKARCH